MPPGARTLFAAIVATTSLRVRPDDASALGSIRTSYAAFTSPLSWTPDTPEICSSAGTIVFFASSDSARLERLFELSESDTTTGCPGVPAPTVGGNRSLGSCPCTDCSAFSTLVRSVLSLDSRVNEAAIDACPF